MYLDNYIRMCDSYGTNTTGFTSRAVDHSGTDTAVSTRPGGLVDNDDTEQIRLTNNKLIKDGR